MSRFEATFGALILVAATLLVTEWVHFRLGDATLWNAVRASSGADSASESSATGLLEPVTESDFERYLGVLERMQADRDLSIDDAAASESLSLADFRHVEQRVQRSDTLVVRTREHLRRKAEHLWDSRVAARQHG